jgi:hypothetical protein
MKTKLAAVGIIVAATLMIATTIASMAPSAMALRTVASNSAAQTTRAAQTGLVNAAGNIGLGANVQGICVNVLGAC